MKPPIPQPAADATWATPRTSARKTQTNRGDKSAILKKVVFIFIILQISKIFDMINP